MDRSVTTYVLCPDQDKPTGGVKMLYRHVDVLNRNGWPASVIHQTPGFRCTWFENDTRICYTPQISLSATDYLVVPEIYGPVIASIQPGIRKVIFNQGCYLTFHGYSVAKKDDVPPYRHPDVIAALVVSEDSREYLRYVFPGLRVGRIHYGIDSSLFHHHPHKRRQMAFMPGRGSGDARQVINALNYRGALGGFDLAPIEDRNEHETASILKQSLIFLSFSRAEGFGLPPAEAMACGCIVVGFHGMGGKEFFKPGHCYPVPQGDIMAFVRTVEQVIDTAERNPDLLAEQGRAASSFIINNYSPAREERDIVQFWADTAARG